MPDLLSEPIVHFHACEDCGTTEPFPGGAHDDLCSWIGFCLRCESIHRQHCRCRAAVKASDYCDLVPPWVEASTTIDAEPASTTADVL
jgi:hypothetical protein